MVFRALAQSPAPRMALDVNMFQFPCFDPQHSPPKKIAICSNPCFFWKLLTRTAQWSQDVSDQTPKLSGLSLVQ